LGISSPKIFRCEARRKERHFVRVKIEAKMFLELRINRVKRDRRSKWKVTEEMVNLRKKDGPFLSGDRHD
jgi:hypothetical protein